MEKTDKGQKAASQARLYHKLNRSALIVDLKKRPIPELVSGFLTEMDLKNEAYFFILENGLFDSFKAFSG
jgi:hypothetical protein